LERITIKTEYNYIVAEQYVERSEGGYSGAAIERLARFENAYEELERLSETILQEIEELKIRDRTHSVIFKEKLGMKVMNANTLNMFKAEGI
jgi:hypothetical protein